MPLFRFHLRTQRGLEYDTHGLHLPDLDAACRDACATVPALTAEFPKACRDPLPCTFLIADAGDRPLMEVPFRDRLRTPPPEHRASDGARGPGLALERAEGLVEALRHEHARLRNDLRHLRALVTDLSPARDARRSGRSADDGGEP